MVVPGEKLICREILQDAVSRLAAEISEKYSDEGFFGLVVLKGAFVFASDLIRQLTCPVEVGFMYSSSYVGTERVSDLAEYGIIDPERLRGKKVIVIEDIIDSGQTYRDISILINGYHPQELKLCSLLIKPENAGRNFAVDYKGFEIEDRFVVGYGLDFNEKFRELPDIHALEELK